MTIILDYMDLQKRKRGRPRKNAGIFRKTVITGKKKETVQKNNEDSETNDSSSESNTNYDVEDNVQNKKTNDENIILYLALSDEDDNQQENSKFSANTGNTTIKNMLIDSLSDTEEDSEGDNFNDATSIKSFGDNNNTMNVKMLINEIKKRDVIIANLKNKTNYSANPYGSSYKSPNINYHCIQMVDTKTGQYYVPQKTDIKCWWCDEQFDNLPVFIVNYYRDNIYYVFGNFCSFNCALKFNVKMLKDYKCSTRHALTLSFRTKVTGLTDPIKMAGDRELLVSKGGTQTIDKFRKGFSMINQSMQISMPPIIPLMHVIKDDAGI